MDRSRWGLDVSVQKIEPDNCRACFAFFEFSIFLLALPSSILLGLFRTIFGSVMLAINAEIRAKLVRYYG